MLSSPHRLAHSRAIARVYSRGHSGSSGSLSVKAAANGMSESRAVVIVSKKVSRRAVVRNRIRRRVAAMLADSWATVAPGYDIVVTVHHDVSGEPAPVLTQHLTAACQRAKLVTLS